MGDVWWIVMIIGHFGRCWGAGEGVCGLEVVFGNWHGGIIKEF